ncbi:MAG: phosphomannomutase/phosphoglucomutase, partial [Methylococcaceae bacterium]|nr:phosphomannomutase/phosphoglucomutase [Methylococcaceae bacterium]
LRGSTPGDYVYKFAEFSFLGNEIYAMRREVRASVHEQPERPIKFSPPDEEPPLNPEREAPPPTPVLSPSLFRAYDIRGVVGESLTAEAVYLLGLAIGSEVFAQGESRIVMARDGRLSSPELGDCLLKGLLDSGCTVVNLGLAPTPLLYFATQVLNTQSGVMLTGSHNPPNYNGLKVVIGREALKDEGIQQLRHRIEKKDFRSGSGRVEKYDLIPDYIERIVGDIQLGRSMKIVMDCGNGAAAVIAPRLMRALGCEVTELFCEVDGHFPNHHPDPSKPENLQALIDKVLEEKAELGVAFDGDGDRLGLVDCGGKIIWPDRQMMLFAADLLSREPGADILFDVKCSRHLASQIVKSGGRPVMWKTGHSPMKAKLKETGALLAGEMSGHIIFAERWYGFDDGIYACARMLEILSNEADTSAKVFAQFPDSINTPELNIPLTEGENSRFIETLRSIADFPDAHLTDIDGLRLDFPEGWGLVRASNTTPSLTLRFEADSEEALARIQQQFRELLQRVKADIQLPF